ncbi:VAP [Symbiodinium sp. CCMP2592]|nr:VAP [Symbiodinium sp. CCMP2592]
MCGRSSDHARQRESLTRIAIVRRAPELEAGHAKLLIHAQSPWPFRSGILRHSLLLVLTCGIMQPCDPSSAFFGFMRVSSALVFANLGAAYGTAKSGVGIASMGVMRPDMIMKSIIPVVMAGVLSIYGLITAVIINGKMNAANYSACALGSRTYRWHETTQDLFKIIEISLWLRALGLYGLIVGLVVASTAEGTGKAFAHLMPEHVHCVCVKGAQDAARKTLRLSKSGSSLLQPAPLGLLLEELEVSDPLH